MFITFTEPTIFDLSPENVKSATKLDNSTREPQYNTNLGVFKHFIKNRCPNA